MTCYYACFAVTVLIFITGTTDGTFKFLALAYLYECFDCILLLSVLLSISFTLHEWTQLSTMIAHQSKYDDSELIVQRPHYQERERKCLKLKKAVFCVMVVLVILATNLTFRFEGCGSQENIINCSSKDNLKVTINPRPKLTFYSALMVVYFLILTAFVCSLHRNLRAKYHTHKLRLFV